MEGIHVRLAVLADGAQLGRLCEALWPDSPAEEHARVLEPTLTGAPIGIFPQAIFIAESEHGELVGFLEAGLRSHADGCDPARPVGYIEGWYVVEAQRRNGVGSKLMAAAEEWARAQGCREVASDAWIDREVSQLAHEALGFEVVDRCVHYRKSL